ncbi:TolC family protein [Serratia ureilytica]|uniref:TolC family protein n=1 Tax=Serratia ureilytica TaxID=300181 RepID=UPI001AA145CC|nr:TolC family protein [Serratia ureilytica]MBO1811261.1 TolC family protein [Serratia ureilytica]
MRMHFFIVPFVFIVNGCSFVPHYEKPMTNADNVQTLFKGAGYGCLMLHDLISTDKNLKLVLEMALKNNYDIKESAIKLRLSERQKLSSVLDLIPSANVTVGKSISMSNSVSLFTGETIKQRSSVYKSSLGIDSYEVDIWGKKLSQIDSLNHEESSYLYASEAMRLTLMSDLASTWYETLSLIKLWHILDNKVKLLSGIEDKLSGLKKIGRLDTLIYTKFLRGYNTDKVSSVKLRKQIINNIHKLEYLSGFKSPYLNVESWSEISGDYKTEVVSQEIKSDVVFSRPDVLMEEEKLKSANGNIGLARASFFPVVNIFAQTGKTSPAFRNVLSNLDESWNLTPSVIIPVFSLPTLINNLELAHSQQVLALNSYRKAVASAMKDISDSVNDMASFAEIVSALTVETRVHRNTFRQVMLQYEAGYLDLYSYYEAIDAISTSEIELESNRQLLMNSTIVVLKSIGG